MIIKATNTRVSTVRCTETPYFTGGLFAQPVEGGHLALVPTGANERGLTGYIASWSDILKLTELSDSALVGVNQKFEGEGYAPDEVWQPSTNRSNRGFQAAEAWGAISYQAHCNNDATYAAVARYLSITIHAAGFRLRDVARTHHSQLGWALLEKRKPGSRFSNVAMTDLYLAFHSLASELCSARDHLAKIAIIQCNAKSSIDGMARFEDWLTKPINMDAASEPLTALLLSVYGTKTEPGWLRTMGDVRNEMVHRQPMAANPKTAFLLFSEKTTPAGPVYTIRLTSVEKGEKTVDPFQTLLDLYKNFESLAISASTLAKYKAEPPQVVGH